MASKLIDLTGKEFGWLTVVGLDHMKRIDGHNRPFWKCLCKCGQYTVVTSNSLKNGSTRSCGCYRKKANHQRLYLGGEDRGRLRSVLRMAKLRCEDSSNEFYHNYGARGISVCDEWSGKDGISNFVEWAMQSGYSPGLTIDRIDNDKGYSPNNCRWATMKEQSNNKGNNIRITIKGETKTLTQWCEHYNAPYNNVRNRYVALGWDIEDALFTPKFQKPISGKRYSMAKGKHNGKRSSNNKT